jgi:hypothetical protein
MRFPLAKYWALSQNTAYIEFCSTTANPQKRRRRPEKDRRDPTVKCGTLSQDFWRPIVGSPRGPDFLSLLKKIIETWTNDK